MPKSELTLQDLTRAALGVSPLTNFNLEVLQILLTHILMKLEVDNVKVKIKCLDTACLNNLVENSKISTLNLYDQKWILHQKLVKRAASLKERLNKINSEVSWGEPPSLCHLTPEQHAVISSIIGNKMFIKLVDLHIAIPVLQEIVNLECEIYDLSKDFANLMQFSKALYNKLALLHYLEKDMKTIQNTMKKNYLKFLIAIEETLDVLEQKLHKSRIEELLKELQRQLKQIENSIEEYKKRISCRKGYRKNNLRCIACNNTEITADVEPMGGLLLPQMGSPSICETKSKNLAVKSENLLLKKMTPLLTSYEFVPDINVKIEGQRILGKKCVGEIVLIDGPDGQLFRKNYF